MDPIPQTIVAAPFGKPPSSSSSTPDGGGEMSFLDTMKAFAAGGGQPDTPPETPDAPAPPETPVPDKKPDETPSAKTGLDALLEEDAPETPVETPAADPADAEDEALIKSMTKKAGAKFAELKAKAKAAATLETKVAALEKQVAERVKLVDADPLKKELAAEKAAREDLAAKLAIASIDEEPAFIKAITEPKQRLANEAVALAKLNELDSDAVITALTEVDPKRQEELLSALADNLSDRQKSKLYTLADKAAEIFTNEEHLRANAAEAKKEAKAREAETLAKSKTDSRAAEMREVANVMEKVAKIAPQFTLEGEDAAAVMEKIALAAQEAPFDEWSVEQKAYAAFAAAGMPRIQKVLKAALAKVAALEKENAGIHAAAPGTAGAAAPAVREEHPSDMHFLDAIGVRRG